MGYSAEDIISTLFRVCKTANLPEYTKMQFIRVRIAKHTFLFHCKIFKEIGLCHVRIIEGVSTLVQLSGLIAKLCVVGK